MNELITVATPSTTVATMSSLEMVEFINSQRKQGEAVLKHRSFMAKVPQVLGEGSVQNLLHTYTHPQNGQTYPCYHFPKREACLMAMSYSYELQAKVFDRMTELEQGGKKAVPQSLPEALRLAADLAERNAQQAQLLEQQKPAVEFVEKYTEAESTKGLSDVAKVLGFKPHTFPRVLEADGVIFKRNSVWVPVQYHIDAGRFVVRLGVRHGFAFNQIRVTPKGELWLSRKYGA
jgi:phage antirepressor YoqD-like protein